jgi:Topoisomerase DNA binding C4 zinc finger.
MIAPYLDGSPPTLDGGRRMPRVEPTLTPTLAPTPAAVRPTPATARVCPLCAAPLVRRRLASGERAGTEFWACSRHPQCRHVETVEA